MKYEAKRILTSEITTRLKISSYMQYKKSFICIFPLLPHTILDFQAYLGGLSLKSQYLLFKVKHKFHRDWTIYIKHFWFRFLILFCFCKKPSRSLGMRQRQTQSHILIKDWGNIPSWLSHGQLKRPLGVSQGVSLGPACLMTSIYTSLQHKVTSHSNSQISVTIQPGSSAIDLIISDKLISCPIWYEN